MVLALLGGAGGYWLRTHRRAARVAAPAPPPAAPRPTPPPPPPPPAAPEPPKGPATLDEAAGALEKDPQAALDFLDKAVATEPVDERAYALRIVALYDLGRYAACGKAIREAREAGHPL